MSKIKEVSENEYIIIQKIGKDCCIKSEIYSSPNLAETILNYAYLIEDYVSPISYAILQKTAKNLRKKGYKSTIRVKNLETYESIKAELISIL